MNGRIRTTKLGPDCNRRLVNRRVINPCVLLVLVGALLPATPLVAVQVGQLNFSSDQLGHVVANFDESIIGEQVTIADFQHGYLITGSGPGESSADSWFDVSNPENPVLYRTVEQFSDKPHSIGFWGSYFTAGTNGKNVIVKNFLTGDTVGRNDASPKVNSLWDFVQAPYIFTGGHGYTTQASELNVWNASDPTRIVKIATIDTGSTAGFKAGAVHAIGNLLIVSGSESSGAAVYDISDPTRPQLMSATTDGNHAYTSMVYGSRVYNGENGQGIHCYDFSDPTQIVPIGRVSTDGRSRYLAFQDGKGHFTQATKTYTIFDAQSLAVEKTLTMDYQHDFTFPIGNMAFVAGPGALNNNSGSFPALIAIAENPDTQGPTVVYGNPVDGAQNMKLSSRIGFSMSDQIDVSSLTAQTFIVRPQGGSAIAGTYSTQMGLINFTPAQSLSPDTIYEVILPAGGIKDVVGNGLTTDYRMSFATDDPPFPSVLSDAVNHWRLDGDGTDSIGTHDGILRGVSFVDGEIEQGAQFNGQDQIELGNIDFGNAFSISMFVCLDRRRNTSEALIANTTLDEGQADGFKIMVNSQGANDGRIIFESGNGVLADLGVATNEIFDFGSWHHVAINVDRTHGRVDFFYDGEIVTVDDQIRNDFAVNQNTFLGRFGTGEFGLNGKLDEVRVFDRLLTVDDVRVLAAEANGDVAGGGNRPPMIQSLTSSANPQVTNGDVAFILTATDEDPDARLEYRFRFGDGTTTSFTTSNTTNHRYETSGRYSVIAEVRDSEDTVSTTMIQIVHHPLTADQPSGTSTIIYDGARDKVWNVNPDNDSVARIDALTRVKEFEIAVGISPQFIALRPDQNEVWVTCRDSSQVAILDASTGAILTSIDLSPGARPQGIAFAPNGEFAYVAESGSGRLTRINASSRAIFDSLELGQSIRSVAVSGDSQRVLVTRFISPMKSASSDSGEVFEVMASPFGLARTIPLAFDNSMDSDASGRGVPNYLTDIKISPDGRQARVTSKKDNTARGLARDGQPLNPDNTVRTLISRLNLETNLEELDERIDVNDQGLSSACVYSPVGDLLFSSFVLNNEVLVFDASTNNALGGVTTGLAPDGICLSPDGARLYVHNFLERSVSTYDTASLVAGKTSAIASLGTTHVVHDEKLSVAELIGKQVFYDADDPRMSSAGYMSCASCHLDGGHDGRVWDFTDRGEGLRNTTTLRGRGGIAHGLLHWSGNFDEVQDFELDIRGAFGGTGFIPGEANASLDTPNAGRSPDLDALASYVSSLTVFPSSPFRDLDGSATANAVLGREHFIELGCPTCHNGHNFTDSINVAPFIRHDVGTIKASSGMRLFKELDGLDAPTLRGIHNTSPYLHDGSAATLSDVFNSFNAPTDTAHARFRDLSDSQQAELNMYLLQLDGEGVGDPIAVCWLKLDESRDAKARDSSGHHDGVITGGQWVAGKYNGGYEFKPKSFIEMPASVLNSVDEEITITLWVYEDEVKPQSASLLYAESAEGNRVLNIHLPWKDHQIYWEAGIHSDRIQKAYAPKTYKRGLWRHWAFVKNARKGEMKIYLDGKLWHWATGKTETMEGITAFRIGSAIDKDYFTGLLDDVRIFDRSLSESQIANLLLWQRFNRRKKAKSISSSVKERGPVRE